MSHKAPHGTTGREQTRLIILFNLALFIYTIRGHNIGHVYMCHADAYEATSLATDFRGSVTRQPYITYYEYSVTHAIGRVTPQHSTSSLPLPVPGRCE